MKRCRPHQETFQQTKSTPLTISTKKINAISTVRASTLGTRSIVTATALKAQAAATTADAIGTRSLTGIIGRGLPALPSIGRKTYLETESREMAEIHLVSLEAQILQAVLNRQSRQKTSASLFTSRRSLAFPSLVTHSGVSTASQQSRRVAWSLK